MFFYVIIFFFWPCHKYSCLCWAVWRGWRRIWLGNGAGSLWRKHSSTAAPLWIWEFACRGVPEAAGRWILSSLLEILGDLLCRLPGSQDNSFWKVQLSDVTLTYCCMDCSIHRSWSKIGVCGESIYILLGDICCFVTMKFVKKYSFLYWYFLWRNADFPSALMGWEIT